MAAAVSLENLRLWTNVALKAFCRKKGLLVTGKKEELIARVFAAHELELPDVLSADEELKLKACDYQSLLVTPRGRQPDPFCELNNWVCEERGKCLWPPTMYCDIFTYFLGLTGNINRKVTQRALNAYKEGKAFSYFDSGWLKEVFYHPITDTSEYCYVKSQCTPSQKIGDIGHSVWVMLEKKSGAIQSAYCTCFAGLGSTCNHVAAVLFKMDFFWRQGLTNKACTEKECGWNKYGHNKPPGKPMKVSDLHFRKPQFGKLHLPRFKELNLKIEPFSFQELSAALDDVCSDAVVFQGVKSVSPNDVFHAEVATSVGPPLCELLSKCSNKEAINKVLSSFTDEDVSSIEKATRGQSDNDLWKQQRVCRITASIAHNVSTRMISLRDESSNRSKDPNPILNSIMKVNKINYNKVPQLKYGIEMEREARDQYKKLLSKEHKCLIVNEVGLVVNREHPQYGASPDGMVSCRCCGTGLLEIKCPLSIAHTTPSAGNLPYLINIGANVYLSKTSNYYSQVQWQMGICQKLWCDFFVYTRHGQFLERVQFSEERFNELMSNIGGFYDQYVIPCILKDNMLQSTSSVEQSSSQSPVSLPSSVSSLVVNTDNCFILSSKVKDCPKLYKKRKTGRKSSEPVYLCGVCSEECLSMQDIETSSDNSVQCNECFQWFHFRCVSFVNVEDDQNEWLCKECKA